MGDVLTGLGDVRAVDALKHLLRDGLIQRDVDVVAANPGHHGYGDGGVLALQPTSVTMNN